MLSGHLQVNRDIIIATKKQYIHQQIAQTPLDAILSLAQMQKRPLPILNHSQDGNQVILIARLTRQRVYDPITSGLHCLANGADAVAFFTDHHIYHDDFDDLLLLSRALCDVPVIFQNYMVDAYAVIAARAAGASSVFLHHGVVDDATLRTMVITAQRWKMNVIVQIDHIDQLDSALQLSPHAFAFGNPLEGRDHINEAVQLLQAARQRVPTYCHLLLAQTLQQVDEIEQALAGGVNAVIVDEQLLKHERTAAQIGALLEQARQERTTTRASDHP